MNRTPTIFTIGYGSSRVGELRALLDRLDAVCVDVRLSPTSWTPTRRREALTRELRERYVWVRDSGA